MGTPAAVSARGRAVGSSFQLASLKSIVIGHIGDAMVVGSIIGSVTVVGDCINRSREYYTSWLERLGGDSLCTPTRKRSSKVKVGVHFQGQKATEPQPEPRVSCIHTY